MRTHRAVAGLTALALGTVGIAIGIAPGVAAADAAPPVVVTSQADGVAQNTATLSGTIDTEGSETVYEFDFGADTSYGTRIFGDAGNEPGEQTYSSPLQSLTPGTTYHYRIVATNAAGTTYGADQAFTTTTYPSAVLAAPPASPLVPALLLSPTSAGDTPGGSVTAKASTRSARAAREGTAQQRGRRSYRQPADSTDTHRVDRKGRR